MSWCIGFSKEQNRDVGYGVPAICDHPGCSNAINRGIGYLCCEDISHVASCQGYFCEDHRHNYTLGDELEDMEPEELEELEELGVNIDDPETQLRIAEGDIIRCHHQAIERKESAVWLEHCLTDDSWETWRNQNPAMVTAYQKALENKTGNVCILPESKNQ